MSGYLKRFLCKEDEFDRIPPDSVFIESGEQWEDRLLVSSDMVLPRLWNHYSKFKSIVLLGPPRIGKTTEFEYQRAQVAHGFFLPLRYVAINFGNQSFEAAIKESAAWSTWKELDEPGELFIDALDEGKIATKEVMNYLVTWLKSLSPSIMDRLRVHLSCRGSEWHTLDWEQWDTLFPAFPDPSGSSEGLASTVIKLVLLNLDRKRYREYCTNNQVNPDELYVSLPVRARQFVARPLTLAMVVDEYRNQGKVPNDTKALYDAAIQRGLSEPNKAHQRHQPGGSRASRNIAEFIASLMVLSDQEIVHTEPIAADSLLSLGIDDYSTDSILATLNSSLFRLYGPGQYRFDDPELADYLAASRLNRLLDDGALATKSAVRVFLGDPGHHEPVPKLLGALVWLAALNSSFRRAVIELNPRTLLEDFPGEMAADEKVAIWNWLKNEFGRREYFDGYNWQRGAGAFACLEIIPEMEQVLSIPSKFGRDFRILALEIARNGRLTEIGPVLERMVQNASDNHQVLSYAAEALGELTPELVPALLPWLDLAPEDDPVNRLRADAMTCLWPDHLSLEQLIANLRPALKEGSVIGGLWPFLHHLPKQLNDDQRADVIDALAADLDHVVNAIQNKQPLKAGQRPSQMIEGFLILQIEAWKERADQLPRMERWINSLLRAKSYSHLHFSELRDELGQVLKENHNFRQALSRQRLERAFKEKDANFEYRRYFLTNGLSVQKEDLEFWKAVLIEWRDRDPRLLNSACEHLCLAWHSGDQTHEIIRWFEEQASLHPKIRTLWDSVRECTLPSEKDNWRHQSHLNTLKQIKKRQDERNYIRDHIEDIAGGDIRLLGHLVDIDRSKNDSIEGRYGQEVIAAYRQGLFTAWENAKHPDFTEYYPDKHLYLDSIIIRAVHYWKEESGQIWCDLPGNMRQTAMQVAVNTTNEEQELFSDLIELEQDMYFRFACEVLSIEAGLDNKHAFLATRLRYLKDSPIYREAALRFIKANPGTKQEVLIPLAQTMLVNDPTEEVISLLRNMGESRLADGDNYCGIRLLAVVWRYEPQGVWQWLKDHYMEQSLSRSQGFAEWINAVMHIHDLNHGHHWPSWAGQGHLLNLLPDLYRFYPPNTDPTVEEFNRGNHDVKHRSDIGHLRYSAISRVIETGSIEANDCIIQMLGKDEFAGSRDSLLMALDRWQAYRALATWEPLKPAELESVLTKGKQPIQSHKDLFDLSVSMLEDIRDNIEVGEANLARLFWDNGNPSPEYKIQSYFFDKIRDHPQRNKIVGSREVEVNHGNIPDIKIQAHLPNGDQAKVYIEVKRQHNNELFHSIETQLAKKYLIDQESRYGIYLVGWYGAKGYWKPNKHTVLDSCGSIPENPQALEACLQEQADQVVIQSPGIDGIKVLVVNLSS